MWFCIMKLSNFYTSVNRNWSHDGEIFRYELTFSRWAPSRPELLEDLAYCPKPEPAGRRTRSWAPKDQNIHNTWPESVRRLTGIPCSCGLSNRLCSSFFDASIFSGSAASTMYLRRHRRSVTVTWLHEGALGSYTHTIALTPRQYRSHMLRKRGWPPMSHNWNTKITTNNII